VIFSTSTMWFSTVNILLQEGIYRKFWRQKPVLVVFALTDLFEINDFFDILY